MEEKSFRFVESKIFTAFYKFLNPQYEKVSRGVLKREVLKIYAEEKKKLKSYLVNIRRLSLTLDLWTATNQKIGYMSLMGHYLDDNWKLRKVILNFRHLPPPHNGVAIAYAIYQCLVECGIDSKISTITLDNASANDTAITKLLEQFAATGKLYFGGKIFQVRCCAHILNLIIQDGLKVIEKTIENVRESIKYIKGSPSRFHIFSEIVKRLELPTHKSLKLDVCTRWNSTFEMLDATVEFKLAFPQYKERNSNYDYLPSQADLEKAEEVHQLLKVFYECTKIFSGNKYPTANLFLPEIWKIKDVLTKKAMCGPTYIREMTEVMKAKFDKYWSECHLLLAVAAFLDPRYKMTLIKYVFIKLYSPDRAYLELNRVLAAIEDILKFYIGVRESMEESGRSKSQGQRGQVSDSFGADTFSSTSDAYDYASFVEMEHSMNTTKSKLDIYFGDIIGNESSDFDVLEWWKGKEVGIKYKTLSMMARDILSIPLSTVASESAFNTGSRVIGKNRSSLASKTVEALICTEDWLRPQWEDEGPSRALYGDISELGDSDNEDHN